MRTRPGSGDEMTCLWIDAPTGLAGDMLLAGMFDLGVPQSVVEEPLHALGLTGAYRLESREQSSGGLRGRRISVVALEEQPPHRQWSEIRDRISSESLQPRLKRLVLTVFGNLAAAEAEVHGIPEERVHFHEVGAIDALVDVIGVCAAFLQLDPDEVCCSPLPAGNGTVRMAHGSLPVPAPAVLELARRHQVPLLSSPDLQAGELVTPTGMALVTALVDRFEPPDVIVPSRVGIGLGHRRMDRPNLVRIVLDSPASVDAGPRWETIVVQEAWIDDATAEDLALLLSRLREAGALDVAVQPLLMKKGRCGQAVTALVTEAKAEHVRLVWLCFSSSIGLRERRQGRWVLPRRAGVLNTQRGPLPAKQVLRPDGSMTVKLEADALADLSSSSGCSLEQLRNEAGSSLFHSDEAWN